MATELGFNGFVYDFSPVSQSPGEDYSLPAFAHTEGMPSSFEEYWMGREFYRIDQIQRHCIQSLRPFQWSLFDRCDIASERRWAEEQKPAFGYLSENKLNCGVSIPLRTKNGTLHTFTAIRFDADRSFENYCDEAIWQFFPAVFDALPQLDSILHQACGAKGYRPLTRQETYCMSRLASGAAPKQIAAELSRSLPTVRFHLYNACGKLQAKNLNHAIGLAIKRRIIDL